MDTDIENGFIRWTWMSRPNQQPDHVYSSRLQHSISPVSAAASRCLSSPTQTDQTWTGRATHRWYCRCESERTEPCRGRRGYRLRSRCHQLCGSEDQSTDLQHLECRRLSARDLNAQTWSDWMPATQFTLCSFNVLYHYYEDTKHIQLYSWRQILMLEWLWFA